MGLFAPEPVSYDRHKTALAGRLESGYHRDFQAVMADASSQPAELIVRLDDRAAESGEGRGFHRS